MTHTHSVTARRRHTTRSQCTTRDQRTTSLHRSTRAPHTTKGSTLVELLVAIPVGAMLTAVAVMLLIDAHRLVRRIHASTGNARELRHAGALLAADLRPLAATDLVAWTDTSIDLDATIGAGLVCAHPAANIIDLLPLHPTDVLRSAWSSSPQAGDRVWVVARDSSLLPQDATWMAGSLASVASATTSACTTSPLQIATALRPMRLALSSSDSLTPPPGTPARITRRVHYALYKASDSQWYLGRRTLGPTGWDVIQPAAGPLRTPAQSGLVLRVFDGQGNRLLNASAASPAWLTLDLHSASSWKQSTGRVGAPVDDSLSLRIALRGEGASTAPISPEP